MIFLSYARADSPLVDHVYERLVHGGLDVWLDRRRLSAGDSWLASIASAIERADAVVVVASQYSTASTHVRWEHEHAIASARRVHVVRVDDGLPWLVGAPNETLHDLRTDPLDPAPWLDLAHGREVGDGGSEPGAKVQPAYIRASVRAAWPVMSLLVASAGVFSIASTLSDEIANEDIANPALLSVYLPGSLVLWAFQWEARRLHLLRRRRLQNNRNKVIPRVLPWVMGAAGLITVAFYWWALLIALAVHAAVRRFRKGPVSLFGRRLGRAPKDPSRPPSSLAKRGATWLNDRMRSSLNDYHNPKIDAWLPAFVERRVRAPTAMDEAAMQFRDAANAARTNGTVRAVALVFADADEAVADRLAAALRTPAELIPLSRLDGQADGIAQKNDSVIFVLSRFSQGVLAELATYRPLVVVAFGPMRIPDSLAHVQLLDLTGRELATVAEAVDETLATGRHGELSAAADRRSSLLGIPADVRSFVAGYLAVMGFAGFILLNGVLEGRVVAAISIPIGLLSLSWLWLVLTRRAPLSLAILTTAIITGVLEVAVARHAASFNNFLGVLVVPGIWAYYQYSEMRAGKREIDMWAPRTPLRLSTMVGIAFAGCVGAAAAWIR